MFGGGRLETWRQWTRMLGKAGQDGRGDGPDPWSLIPGGQESPLWAL